MSNLLVGNLALRSAPRRSEEEERTMRVIVEKVGNRIYLRTPWRADMPDRCKRVGGRWAKEAKAWTYPLDLETCRRLREEFKDDLVIGQDLWGWAKQEAEKESHLHAVADVRDMDVMASITLPRVQELAPTMWAAMTNRPYQPVASLYMAQAGQSLCADEPGVGKTIESLGAMVEGGVTGAVLVLAPLKSTQAVWEPEIHRWLVDYKPGYTVTRVSGMGKGAKLDRVVEEYWSEVKANPDGLHFLIANAEMARVQHKGLTCPKGTCDGYQDWCPDYADHKGTKVESHPWLFWTTGPRGGKVRRQWDAIIADETHKWLINTRGKNASQVGFGFAALQTTPANIRIAMTGTPLKGKPINLFGTLNWLRPTVYSSKWRWAGQHLQTGEDDWGHKTVGGLKEDAESFFRSLKSVMIRRSKRELRAANPAWMPPDKQYHDVYVEMVPKQRKVYDTFSRRTSVELESGTLTKNGILAEMTRLKQMASCSGDMVDGHYRPQMPSAKFEWLLEFLEERGIDTKQGRQQWGDLDINVRKVVVASQFTTMIDLWEAEANKQGIRTVSITGKTKDALGAMRRFQEDDRYRVCFINTQAGGVSITLDAADDIVLMDETWVPDDQVQVEDRVHRASNVTHQVDVWYVRTKDTIEEQIAQVNADKAEANHVVLDAQRGLVFARQMRSKK